MYNGLVKEIARIHAELLKPRNRFSANIGSLYRPTSEGGDTGEFFVGRLTTSGVEED